MDAKQSSAVRSRKPVTQHKEECKMSFVGLFVALWFLVFAQMTEQPMAIAFEQVSTLGESPNIVTLS